jgi:hypothetical protein
MSDFSGKVALSPKELSFKDYSCTDASAASEIGKTGIPFSRAPAMFG